MAFPTGWQTTGQAELDAIYRRFQGGLAGPTATQSTAGPAGFPILKQLQEDSKYYGVNPVFNSNTPRAISALVTPPVRRYEGPSSWSAASADVGTEDQYNIMNPRSMGALESRLAMQMAQSKADGASGTTGAHGDSGSSSIAPMEGTYMDSRYGKNVFNPDGSINPQLSLENRTGKKFGVPSGEIGTEGDVRAPSQNAMQKQQAAAEEPEGIRGISPQRRYFWATGRVDARPTQSPRNAPTDFDATFGPNRQHMGGMPVTWEARQAINRNAVADVRALRGLSPY